MEVVLSNLIKNLGAISSACIIQYETVCSKSNKEEFIGTNKEKINKERRLPQRLYLKNGLCNFVVRSYNIICIEEETLLNYEPPLIPE